MLFCIALLVIGAHIAVDVFLGYQQCHFSFLSIGAPAQAHNLP